MRMERRENKKMKYDWSDSSSSSSSDESIITGNDSSDYNDRAKFGGAYMLQSCVRNENAMKDESISFPESKFDLESPQDSDFSATYGRSVRTSTWLETQDFQGNQELQSSPAIQNQISKINMMFSSFAENSQQELKVLNNLVQAQSGSTKQKTKTSSMDKLERENLSIAGSNTISGDNKSQTIPPPNIVTLPTSFEGFDNENLSIAGSNTISGDKESQTISPPNIVTLPISFEGFDGDLHENSLNYDEITIPMFDPDLANPNISISNVDEVDKGTACVSTPNSVIPAQNTSARVQPDATFDVQPRQTPKKEIQLPMGSIPDFETVEIMLDKEDIELEKGAKLPLADGLAETLRPLSNEAEPKYMNRAIESLFEQNFFLESVCWQTAKNRINIRGSYILGCWKRSFEEVYGADDEKDTRFMSHFRRYKSAKRAADKASGKKKMGRSKK